MRAVFSDVREVVDDLIVSDDLTPDEVELGAALYVGDEPGTGFLLSEQTAFALLDELTRWARSRGRGDA